MTRKHKRAIAKAAHSPEAKAKRAATWAAKRAAKFTDIPLDAIPPRTVADAMHRTQAATTVLEIGDRRITIVGAECITVEVV